MPIHSNQSKKKRCWITLRSIKFVANLDGNQAIQSPTFSKVFFTEVSIMQWPRKTASEAVLASDWRWNTLKLTREMMAWFYRPIEKAIFFQNSFSFPPFRNVTNFTPINRETCVKLFERYRQTTYNSKKCKKYEIRFTEKTALFRKGFQTLNARPERTALSSNVDQFCKQKSSCFMRESDFVCPGICDVAWSL